ncbi:MAG: TonB-dependent receptor, partial [Pirellulaceae bacterium]|nr:TonB-dependent receptor [Pirellulaceae bacterium]
IYGFELNGTYELNERWRLTAWYAFLVEYVEFPAGYTPNFYLGSSPRNQAYLQSSWDLGRNVSFDMMFRYVDSLGPSFPARIDSYLAGDVRLAWRPSRSLEFSVVGQNLFAGKHFEFTYDSGAMPTEIEPGVYGMVSWRH